MAAINFPTPSIVGETFTQNNKTFKWDGISWLNISIPEAVGGNTQVQFNDSFVLTGNAGFTYNKTTNTVTVANTIIVGTTATVNGSLANLQALNVVNQTNTTTLYVTTSANVGTAFTANSTKVSLTVNTSIATGSTVDFQDNLLIRPIIKDYGLTHNILGNVSSATTIDLTLGNYVSATVIGATQFTFSNPTPTANACGFILELTNGGSAVITWPTIVSKWPGGNAPSLTVSGADLLTFITDDAGGTWRGVLSMGDSK